MTSRSTILALALLLVTGEAVSQDALNNIVRSSTTSKTTFAAFDVRPAGVGANALPEAIAAAFRKHYDGVRVAQQMAPYPLPTYAPRMSFHQAQSRVGLVSVPDCPQASVVVTSSDHTMDQYGETSVLQACVFPYRDGYRVNVYALFAQKSGGPDIGVLGAMLGRVVTNAIGIGDSGKFIGETIDDIEARLKALTPDVALVELQPARADRPVVADRAAPAPLPASESSAVMGGDAVPPALAEARARVSALLGQARAAAPIGATRDRPVADAVQARKELNAMGLTYYSQDQFVEAARRGDRLACELFLRAGSVKAAAPDGHGVTALKAAATPDLASFLAAYPQ